MWDVVAQSCVTDKRMNNSMEISSTVNEVTNVSRCTQIATNKNPVKSSIASGKVETIERHAIISEACTEITANEMAPQARNSTTKNRSPTKRTENVNRTDQTLDMWKDKKLFSKFCEKLLAKLQMSLDGSIDFSSDLYKMFLQCNEIPLRDLLQDVCANNENNVQSILNNKELFEALQRYYYFKYMTNQDFALKYPVKKILNQTRSTEEAETEKEISRTEATVLDKTKLNTTSSLSHDGNSTLLNSINIHDETVKDATDANPEISDRNFNSDLEKAKRIFFRNVDKTHTLAYVLRTTFGYKQTILRTILNLTFNEFLELTTIYEGAELYADSRVAECMYRYVCRTPLVWPTNLFIPLDDLCHFLHLNNVHFDNYSTMLFYISPKLLHWSNLLSCTNILECVKMDYEKRTGRSLYADDIPALKQECVEYYNRCWKHEKWLAATPVLHEEFVERVCNYNTSGDVMIVQRQQQGIDCCPNDEGEKSAGNDADEACKPHASNSATDVIVLSPSEMNRPASPEKEYSDINCVLLPSTQQQIEMLPAEQSVSHDPLNSSAGDQQANLNVSELSHTSYEVETVGELIEAVKTEPVDKKLLSNLFFYEDENNEVQCIACEEEIVELDTTLQSQGADNNLPPSQIDFDVLLNSEDLHSLLVPQFPNTAGSANNANTQQQPSFALSGECSIQLQDVSLMSSGEKAYSHESAPAMRVQDVPVQSDLLQSSSEGSYLYPKNCSAVQDVRHLSTALAETQASSANFIQHQEQQELNQESVKTMKGTHSILAEKRNQPAIQLADEHLDLPAGSSKTSCKSSYQTNSRRKGLPKHAGIMNAKNVATVKPLPNSNLVPQIQHNVRPLQTVPVLPATSSSTNLAPTAEAQIITPASVTFNLTPPTGSSESSIGTSSQNSSLHLQLPHFGTHIFISQELNENCSLFDNSSLLRIADHNYHKHPGATSSVHKASDQQQQVSQEASTRRNEGNSEQSSGHQPIDKTNVRSNARKTTRQNSQLLSDCNQSNTRSSLLQICNANATHQQQPCGKIITRRISSLCKNTDNEKVNNITLTNTNNLVTSITITINQQHLGPALHPPIQSAATEMVRKDVLYRCISKFHYFKELTPQHMSEYLLPSLPIGKSYSEALIVCENFKTRISNRSISALFPFWSQALQRDFLLVAGDLKEFHYNVFDRKSLRKQEDLRARVLFWLLDTAPAFSLCQFVYEKNNSEFSHCQPIQSGNDSSYKRAPFKSLANALSAKILKKLEQMKSIANAK